MMKHEAHLMCTKHMNRFVRIQMEDGAIFDGVIEHVDDEHVFMASPIQESRDREARYLPYPGQGPGFGYGYGYPGFPYGYHYPRFRRIALPLAGFLALSLLPYWYPFGYPYGYPYGY